MKIVIDASTLISLAKIDAIDLLKNINGELICPHEVFREAVIEGKDKGHQDAEIINHIFNSGLVAAVTATYYISILSVLLSRQISGWSLSNQKLYTGLPLCKCGDLIEGSDKCLRQDRHH